MASAKAEQQSKLEQYFATNDKFFGQGDIHAKRAFFCLGMYCRRVSDVEEKSMAESGTESKFQAKLAKLIGYNMSYRNFSMLVKLLDSEAIKLDMKLYAQCSGLSKQYMINSDLVNDKKALSIESANLAFSLGMYQTFKD